MLNWATYSTSLASVFVLFLYFCIYWLYFCICKFKFKFSHLSFNLSGIFSSPHQCQCQSLSSLNPTLLDQPLHPTPEIREPPWTLSWRMYPKSKKGFQIHLVFSSSVQQCLNLSLERKMSSITWTNQIMKRKVYSGYYCHRWRVQIPSHALLFKQAEWSARWFIHKNQSKTQKKCHCSQVQRQQYEEGNTVQLNSRLTGKGEEEGRRGQHFYVYSTN